MSEYDKILFRIQAAPSAIRDTVSNRYWICGALIAIALWILLSSTVFYFLQCGAGETCADFGDSMYFTAINVTTVGFGDISPTNGWTKALAVLNALVGLISFGMLVAIFSAALQPSGFSGSGIVSPSKTPAGPAENRKEKVSNDDANPEQAAALRFLASLGELIEGQDRVRHSEIHIRVRANTNTENSANVSVHVFVERWP